MVGKGNPCDAVERVGAVAAGFLGAEGGRTGQTAPQARG